MYRAGISSLLGKITVLFVICFFGLPAQAKYGGGSGTSDAPYLIYDANQMSAIGADANDWDKCFKLMADIDLSSYTGDAFNIIGYFVDWDSPDNKPFTGVFDGNGHTISNFNYNSTETYYIGLFVYVEGPDSEIKNLGLIEPNVHAGTGSVVGSLVGNLRDGTISNCYTIDGSITGYYIGGLAGVNYSGSLLNCYFTGDVSGDGGVGGLVAYNSGSVSKCYSIGDVSGDYDVGGLVGINAGGSISNCYSTASVSGDNTLGGLVGYNHSGTITDSYSTGGVSGRIYIGGLLGYNYYGTILNCCSAGSVKGYQSLGGLVGCNIRGDIVNSFWDIETSGQKTSDGGTGLPTPEMQTMSTFTDAGWDFENVWWILEGIGYPRLLWEDKYGGGKGEPNDPYLIYTAEQMNTIGAFQRDWDKHFKLMADIDLSTLLPPPPPSIFKAGNPNPADGASGVSTTVDLSWTAGLGAKAHDVYFGTTSSPPFVCSQTFTTFDPGTMANGTTYYWRIDEFDGSVAITGDLWTFTTVIPPPPPPQLLSTPPPSTVDVDLSDYHEIAFNIIGSIDNPFTGVFDGNGHTISTFTWSSTDRNYIGLFGYVDDPNAVIKDLGLIAPNVDAGTGRRVGSLLGRLQNGAITGCFAESGSVVGNSNIGGLVGFNRYGTITDSYSSCSVSGVNAIGGLTGSNVSTIINSYSTCSVSGTGRYVGGLVGVNNFRITNSYSIGPVLGDEFVGGLVGDNAGTITNCYVDGVSVAGDHDVGGLVGRNSYQDIISNCYATSSVKGVENVGGLVGYNYNGMVVTSFWDIETSGQTTSAGGTGLPTAEMQMMSTFTDAGWDFVGETVNGIEDIWFILQGDYPRLWWEGLQVPMKLTPRTLNCRSKGNWVKAHITLPQGFTVADVDSNRPAVLYSIGFQSAPLYVFINENELVEIEATFERKQVCSLTGNWPQALTVTGFLADGNIFLGTSKVRVIHLGMKVIEDLAGYWLNADCVHPDFCDGIDMNRDSSVNLLDYALLMNTNVEFISNE
jgi:hypothetical protein